MGAFIAPIIAGLSALTGGLSKQKQTSDTNSTSTTTPNYDPATAAFKNLLLGLYTKNLNNLPSQDQFTTAGVKNLTDSSDAAQSGLSDILASRGLSRTTAGGSSAFDTSYKQGQGISNFLTNAPFNYQTAIQPELSGGSAFLSSLPLGTTTTGSSHTVGTGGPSSPVAGAITGGASGLAGYLGQIQAQNSLGNILKSLGQNSSRGGSILGQPNYGSGFGGTFN